MDTQNLIEQAINAKQNAYAKISNFTVGACLLTKSGKTFCGSNVEFEGCFMSICAERLALANALTQKEYNFEAICVVGNLKEYCFPCGTCRQALADFSPNMKVIVAKSKTDYQIFTLQDLLPHTFKQ